jgi:ABC-type bacteriocin/lantibiotic exporter with double-glycine peptidase domain
MQNALLAAAITLIIFALFGIIVLGAIYMPLLTLGIAAVAFMAFIFGVIYYTLKKQNDDCTDF